MSTDNGRSGHLQYSDERLGEFLVRLGVITPEDVERILSYQADYPHVRFGEIAVELGVLNEEALDKVLKLR